MRHVVRAPLFVAISLLASVATAYAECAWVLWVEQPSGSNQWNLSTAIEFVFDTKTKCDQAAAAALDARISEVERQEKVLGRRLDAPTFFKCLPDTLDPRGPRK